MHPTSAAVFFRILHWLLSQAQARLTPHQFSLVFACTNAAIELKADAFRLSLREISRRIGRKKSTVCAIVAAGLPADLVKITRRPGSKATIEVPLIQRAWQLAEQLPSMLAQQAESRLTEQPLSFGDESQLAILKALERLTGQFGAQLSGKPDSLTATSAPQGKLSGFPDSLPSKLAGFPDSLRETIETVRIPGQFGSKLSSFPDSLGAPIDSKAKPSDSMFDRSASGALSERQAPRGAAARPTTPRN